jgi:hypothetical protein
MPARQPLDTGQRGQHERGAETKPHENIPLHD